MARAIDRDRLNMGEWGKRCANEHIECERDGFEGERPFRPYSECDVVSFLFIFSLFRCRCCSSLRHLISPLVVWVTNIPTLCVSVLLNQFMVEMLIFTPENEFAWKSLWATHKDVSFILFICRLIRSAHWTRYAQCQAPEYTQWPILHHE